MGKDLGKVVIIQVVVVSHCFSYFLELDRYGIFWADTDTDISVSWGPITDTDNPYFAYRMTHTNIYKV